MARNDSLVTVYQKTTRPYNPIIIKAIDDFNKLGILTVNLGGARTKFLKDFFEQDLKWLQFTVYGLNDIEEYLRCNFESLTNWIKSWRDEEEKNAGHNSKLLGEYDRISYEIKVSLLTSLMCRGPGELNNLQPIARNVLEVFRNQPFDYLLMNAKKDYFKTVIWPQGKATIPWKDFVKELKNDLCIFTNNGINQIYEKEIKKHLRIENDVPFSAIESIFSYFFGSFLNFRRFINRNYLYGLIESGLEKNFCPYEDLLGSRNTNLSSITLMITECPFPGYREKTFEIGIDGLKTSERHVGDQIVVFGKESHEEFTNDISLPNMKQVDSIFAFIYVNSNGYNLVDISENGVIKVKLDMITKEVELKNGMIVVIGAGHEFLVTLGNPIMIGNQTVSMISIDGVPNCKTTYNTQTIRPPNINNEITIGRTSNNTKQLDYKDVSEPHAKIYFKDGSWYLRDLESTNGTFYKLKTKDKIDSKEPSEALLLKELTLFTIANFKFFVIPSD
jgi:FHA domain